MDRLRNAARHGVRTGMMLAAVAAAAGWSEAQAETWQQRPDALEAGAPARLDVGTPQLAQESGSQEPITLGPVTVEGEGESATGPVDGYVATQSTTGSKTDTPIIETPQSISVITADQMDSRAAGSLGESFRYTPGIIAEQWGTDQRGYGIKIRGFDANDNSFYKDGLQLQGTNYVSLMTLDTYGAERLELLRGPASVLYGQNGLFRFQLNGSNLADKAYVASCYTETSCFYGERRAVIGTVTYRW